jgi:hypothetical protein
MSYASWNGPGAIQTIPNNTTITTVNQNGSNYQTTVNLVPEVIDRGFLLSTMKDEAVTTFFQASNVPPGLYKAGFWWQAGTGAADPWQARDYFSFFVASDDYLKTPLNSNAGAFYKTKSTYTVPFTEGIDPIGAANGSSYGIHQGFLNISSIQKVNFCAFMEDFADNPNTHSVAMGDPFLQKIG